MSDNINVKRLAKNTILLYVRMILVMGITIYMARVVLRVLGVQDYGIYSVVAGAVTFLGFLNNAMSMATQRFLNVELGRTEGGDIRRVFNMSLNIHLIVGVIVVLLAETLGLWIVNSALNIPIERMSAANWSYQFVVATTFVSIIQVPYNSAIFAYEKMGVYAYLSIFDVCLKLALALSLVYFSYDKLILYSLLVFAVHVLLLSLYSGYVSAKFKECRLKLIWDYSLFKKMVGFLGWNVCGQMAMVLTTQGVSMIANIFYGVIINAAMEITNQVNGAISMFVNNFQTSFRPQIMKSYAAKQFEDMRQLTYKASKVSFFLLYLISVPIMLNMDFILKLWLETVPDYSASFCRLLIWYSYFEALGMPLVMVIMSTGYNKNYQIFVSLAISLNVLLTWVFLSLGYLPEWIFYIKIAVSFVVISVRLFFAEKQASVSYKRFLLHSLVPVLKVVIITQPVYFVLFGLIESYGVLGKIIITSSYILFLFATIWLIGFTKGEQLFIKRLVLDKIRR